MGTYDTRGGTPRHDPMFDVDYDGTDALEAIFQEIEAERIRQDGKWGTEVDDIENTPWMWAAYIGLYATKWMVGTFMPLDRTVTDAFRAAMVKVASIAVAAIQSVDRQRAANGTTFYES